MTTSANLNGTGAINMDTLDLSGIPGGTVGMHTATKLVVTAGGVTFTFFGTSFGSYDGSGFAHAGDVSKIQINDTVHGTTLTLNNIQIDWPTLNGFISTNDVAGFEAAVLSGDDSLKGTSGSDVLRGFDGDDTIDLTADGVDSAYGGIGDDVFKFGTALSAGDHVDGGSGNDTIRLTGDYAGLVLSATTITGIEAIVATSGAISLTTNDANVAAGEMLTFDAHNDGSAVTFNGGAETDGSFYLRGGGGSDNLTGGSNADTITTGDGFNQAHGGDGNDTITGGQFNDSLYGQAGNDTIKGGDGFDTVDGGDGDDILWGGLGGDHIDGGNGNDTIYGDRPGPSSETSDDENDINAGAGDDVVYGGAGSNVVQLGDGNDTFTGGQSQDFVTAGTGDDVINGNASNDTLDGGAGNDRIHGGDGDDGLSATGESSGLFASAPTIYDTNDTLFGDAGNDSLDMAAARGMADGGDGVDFGLANLSYVSQAVTFTQNDSVAKIKVAGTTYVTFKNIEHVDVSGGSADDHLVGGALDDNLRGNAGNDTLAGGDGFNNIYGGTGADTLSGGTGRDFYFYYDGGDSSDTQYDTLDGFQFGTGNDAIVVLHVPKITSIDTAITSGHAAAASLGFDLGNTLETLSAHAAVLFTPDSGDLSGQTFLVLDANGLVGFQAGTDIVIHLTNAQNADQIALGNFF